ncbi:MAG: hypothetical protein ACT4QD_04930 [Acidobacteriota bacterium]
MTRRLAWMVIGLAWAMAGCQNVTTPTAPNLPPATDTFTTQIVPGGVVTRSFRMYTRGTFSVTMTRIGPPDGVVVGLGVGIPRADGTGCTLSQWVATTASANPQIVAQADGGAYCVRVFDLGNLTGETTFTVTVSRS